MENLTNCPVCNNKNTSFYKEIRDHQTSKEAFKTEFCEQCTLVFTNPRPDETNIGKYYESKDYISHTNKKETLFEKVYHIVRKRAINKKHSLVASFGTNKKILDYGCGTGDFLQFCKENSWDATGAEPNENARNVLSKKGVNALQPSDIFKLDETFGIITLWHVLEHVHTLNETIEQFKKLLDSEGRLIIAVPNYTSYDAQHYNENWAAYDIPIHLYHFSPKSIRVLFEKHGFSVEKTLPMVFDSFYVSLLSQEFKSGSNPIKAMIIGLLSNIKAFFSKEDVYSSQIYIIKKN